MLTAKFDLLLPGSVDERQRKRDGFRRLINCKTASSGEDVVLYGGVEFVKFNWLSFCNWNC